MMSENGELSGGSVFVKLGPIWFVRFADEECLLEHSLGFYYLRELLRHPRVDILPLELIVKVRGASTDMGTRQQQRVLRALGRSDPLLDPRYIEDCRRRLAEVARELEGATAENNLGRMDALAREKGHIESILEKGLGLGNHLRKGPSLAENARSSVHRAIARARNRIWDENPALGKHLKKSIHAGSVCAYEPDELLRITWTTELATAASAQQPVFQLVQTR